MFAANFVRTPRNGRYPAYWNSLLQELNSEGSRLQSRSKARPQVTTTEAGVAIVIPLAGRRAEDFEVTADRELLTVSVQAAPPAGEGMKVHLQERDLSAHRFEFRLPFAIQQELTDVSYLHGVLRISVSVPPQNQPRKLPVKHS